MYVKVGDLIKVTDHFNSFFNKRTGYWSFIKLGAPPCIVISTHKKSSMGVNIVEFWTPWNNEILSKETPEENKNEDWYEIINESR